MRQAVVALGVVVIAVGALWLVIGGEALDRDDGEVVTIESISPSSAMVGTEIVIRGEHFDAEGNDIGFVLDGSAQSFPMGYHWGVPSEDGKTLRFELPEILGACHSHYADSGGCPAVGLPPPVGATEV